MIHHTHRRFLKVLFRLARQDCPANRHYLAILLALNEDDVAMSLDELQRLGLVEAEQVRLTLAGLAVAVTLVCGHKVVIPRSETQLAAMNPDARAA